MKRLTTCILIFTGILANLAFTTLQQPQFKFTDTNFVVGATLTRRSITYKDVCQTKLTTGIKTLDSLTVMLTNYPNLKIEIGVYAAKPCKMCSTCSPTQNAAETIKAYLVKKGINEKRVLAKGYGLTQPLVNESDKRATLLNARTVIKITYNKF